MARSGATTTLRVIIMSDNSNSDTEADEQTVAELKERIGELEERVEQQEAQRGTSRRQFLGSLTGIASAGAAGYYLGTQRAQAAPNWGAATGTQGTETTPLSKTVAQTGLYETLGTSSTPVPNAYINNADVTALNAEQMGSERHYAGSYGGGDADARLDNAISAAGDGHTIYLEQATYSDDRSISTSLSFIGPSATAVAGGLGSEVSGTWTFSASCVTDQVRFTGGVTADADSCGVLNGLHTDTAAFEVNGDDFRYIGNINGAVTFANGTQGGIVDACTGTSYTDNDGGNKQGDIA